MTPRSRKRQTKTAQKAHPPADQTFMDHVQELRSRLFWIALIFIVAAAVAYPFFDFIIDFLVRPLGNQQLFYLTPIGGLGFIIKVCIYTGAVVAVPAMTYHLYRYLQPVIGNVKGRVVVQYMAFSVLLAGCGIAFAYSISLPAALHFLTNFNIDQVTAMLTADSYLSFTITYLFGAALLFQLPLVLLIINSVKPLSPSGLMKYQRHVILGAFVLGAIISPTPDALNQALLAGPVIVMYQVGILLVWLRNKAIKRQPHTNRHSTELSQTLVTPVMSTFEVEKSQPVSVARPVAQRRNVLINDFHVHKSVSQRIVRQPASMNTSRKSLVVEASTRKPSSKTIRGLDGFAINM